MTDTPEDLGIQTITPPGLLAFGLPEAGAPPEEEGNPFGKDPDARPVGFVERMGKAFRAEMARGTIRGALGMAADKADAEDPERMEMLRRIKERVEDESPAPRPDETPYEAAVRARNARRRREMGITVELPDARRQRQLNDLMEWEAIPDASAPLDYLATMLGMGGAGLTSPEGWITRFPGLGRLFAGSARPTAAAIAEAAITQAGVNIATDPAVQGLNVAAGIHGGYDPLRTLLSGGVGALAGGAIAGTGIMARKVAAGPEFLGEPLVPTKAEKAQQFPVQGPVAPAPVVARIEIGTIDPLARRPSDPPAPPREASPTIEAPAPGRLAEQPALGEVQMPVMRSDDPAARQAIKLQDEAMPSPKAIQPQAAIATAPPSPGKPAGVFMFDATKLRVDPERFQFKSEVDAEGVSSKLKSVKEWDPAKANQIIVWQATDGSLYVADGHQRTGLARRLSADGKPVEIPGLLYREADGWTPEDVMVLAAEKNIGEGSGSIVDAAKIMRAQPHVGRNVEGISDYRIRQASDLAGLGNEPWRMVLNEVIDPEQGAMVGRLIRGDEPRQLAAIAAIERFRPANLDETAALVRKVAQSELVKQNERAQSSLFGDDAATSTVIEEIRIAAQAAKLVRSDKALFGRVLNDADRIEAAGSNINRGAAAAIKDDAGRIAAYITSQADTPGPIRDALLKLAREVKDGTRSYADAARTLVEDVRRAHGGNDAVRSGAGGRAGGEGPAAPVAGVDPTAAGPQTLIPGVASVSERQKLEVQAGKPLAGGNAAPPAGGIFDLDAQNQQVLFRRQSQQQALATIQAAGTPAAPATGQAATAGPSPQILSLQQQVMALDAALDLPTRQGRLRDARALGQYDTGQGVVRLKVISDFETQSHEVGHAIEQRIGAPVAALQQTHTQELSLFANLNQPNGVQEAFAEFVATWMTAPAFARARAPALNGAFEAMMQARAPETFKVMQAAQAAHQAYVSAPSDARLAAMVVMPEREGVRQAIKDLGFFPTLRLGIAKTYEGMFDDKQAVTKMVRLFTDSIKTRTGQLVDLKAADNPNVLLRLAERAHQGALHDMLHGVRPYHTAGVNGTSLHDAINMAIGKPSIAGKWDADMMDRFGEYLVARRAEWLWERYNNGTLQHRPLAMTMPDVQAAIATFEAANPTWRAAGDQVHQYTRDLLRKMYDGHLIDKDFYDKLLEERFYVPFYRDMRDKPMTPEMFGLGAPGGKTQLGPGAVEVIKAIKGSDRDIINPLRGLMFQSFLVNRTIAHNDAVLALVRMAGDAGPMAGRFVERIPAYDAKGFRFDLYEAANAAAKQHGINPMDAQFLTSAIGSVYGPDPIMATMFRRELTKGKGEPILFYREGGQIKALRLINDKEGLGLYEAFTAMPNTVAPMYQQIIGSSAWALHRGIVTHPTFAAANYIRDQAQAFVFRRDFVPFWDGIKGMIGEVRQSEAAKIYASSGGVTPGAAVGSVNEAVKGEIQALAKRGFAVNRLTSLHGLIELTGTTETGTRVGIFNRVFEREQALGRSPYEAAIAGTWEATDFTDWSRHGSKTEIFRHLVPFLNAGLVGFDKAHRVMFQPLLRATSGGIHTVQEREAVINAAASWAKSLGLLSTIGFIWAWWQSGKPAYDDAGAKLKATHLVADLGNGTAAVIPKPFDYAGFAMTLGEEAFARFIAKDPRAMDRLTESFAESVLSPVNPVRWFFDTPGLKTGYELYANRNLFTGRDIVPDELKNLPPSERVTDRTSPVAKWAARAINGALSPFTDKGVSPMQLDHVVGSLFGLYGRDLIALSRQADAVANDGATPGWEDTVMARRFIKPETVVRDTTRKFWDLAADRSGAFAGAVKRYEDLLKRFSDAEASDFLAKLKPAQRVYVTLSSAVSEDTGRKKFTPDDRRMHPAVRGADAAHLIAGYMKELETNSQVEVLTGDRMKIDPDTRGHLMRQLRRLQVMEMQHALTVLGEEGYANRPLPPVKEQMEVLRAIHQGAADELAQRYAQKKIYSAEAAAKVWPEVRKRILDDGGNADLSGLRAEVLGGGWNFDAVRERRAVQKRRVPIPPQRPEARP